MNHIDRLLFLFELWVEKESIALAGRGRSIPDGGFVWLLDKLGRWHHGSYDGRGSFGPDKKAFCSESYGKKLSMLSSESGTDTLDRVDDEHFKHFIPLAPSFTLIRGNVPQKYANSRLEEFGVVFRKLGELEQGLIIMGHFAGVDEWLSYLREKGVTKRRANAMLVQIWLKIIIECRKRGLP